MWCRYIPVMLQLGEAVTRYFLTRYITVCEQFDYAMAESDYEECGAFNSARLNQAMYMQVEQGQSELAAQPSQGRKHRNRPY